MLCDGCFCFISKKFELLFLIVKINDGVCGVDDLHECMQEKCSKKLCNIMHYASERRKTSKGV